MLSITATQLPRFLKCGGYDNLLVDPLPLKENKTRDEGNDAHWAIEQVIKNGMTVDELIDRQAPNGTYIDNEMIANLTPYLQECQGAEIEKDVSFNIGNIRIRARVDCVKETKDTIYISDLKYGWSIVEPYDNWTMAAYALGAVNNTDKKVILKIYQPRPFHKDGSIRTCELSQADIARLWENLNHLLEQALESKKLNTGDHCKNCNKAYDCPALLYSSYNAIDSSTQVYNNDLTNEQLSSTLDEIETAINRLQNIYDSYVDDATNRIIKGQIVKNRFVDQTTSNLTWNDGISPEFLKSVTACENVEKKTLITPTQAIKLGISEKLVKLFSSRKKSGLKLIKSDTNKRASKIFKTETKK